MKKLLLSLLAVAGMSIAAAAAEVTFDFVNNEYGMTRLSGSTTEYVECPFTFSSEGVSVTIDKTSGNGWRLWSDGLRVYKTGSGYASMLIKIDNAKVTGIEFTCKTAFTSATVNGVDMTMAGKTFTWSNTAGVENPEVRIIQTVGNYAMQTLKITYDGSGGPVKEDAGLAYATTSYDVVLGEAFEAPELINPNKLAVTYNSDNEEVATVNAEGAVAIVGAGTATITAKSEATDKFYAGSASYTVKVTKPVAKATVEKVSVMSDGKFAIYTPEGVAKNYTGTNAYGYLYLEAVTPENNKFEVNEDYLIEFTSTDKGYTMKDYRGKFMGMDATHWGSFNFYDSSDAAGSNCYWKLTFEGDNVKIENIGREGAYLSYKKYNNDWELVTTDNADQPLVQLFKKTSAAGIEGVVVDENAPVEYYNLQGVRVANPENGLYIRRQGNKATKVLVK